MIGSDRPSARAGLLPALTILLLTIAAYAPVIGAGFIWDDNIYVTEQPAVLTPDGLADIWVRGRTPQYYPLVYTSFWIEHAAWGLNPAGYHFVNLLLHAVNALLVWRLARRLGLPGAWMIGAVFALHTVHVESVAWISERKNVLSGLFYLLAMLCGLRYDDARESDARSWTWYAGTVGLFVLALLSKSVTCSLPAALILLMVYRRRPLTWRRLLPLAPMFAIGVLAALNTAAIERASVGAVGSDWDFSLLDRTLIASRALLFYPWKLLWPHPVMFVYPRWAIDDGAWWSYWTLLPVLVAAAACLSLLARGRRGPFVALAFYAGTVFPAIGFFNVYPHRFSFVADHFQYLASLGVLALVIAGATTVLRRSRAVSIGLAALVLVTLGSLTYRQAATYRSAETVWLDTLAKNDDAWMPHAQMALVRLRDREAAVARGDEAAAAQRLADAAHHAERALSLEPDNINARSKVAEVLRLQGRPLDALPHQRRAIELIETRYGHLEHRPAFHAQEYLRLARIQDALGATDEAGAAYDRARALRPDEPAILAELAFFHRRHGRDDDARRLFDGVLALDGANVAALMAQGTYARDDGDHARAAARFESALRAADDPTEQLQAVMSLVDLLATSTDPEVGNPARAVALAEDACAATGRAYPELLELLAVAYAAADRPDDAMRTLGEAAALAERLGLETIAASVAERMRLLRDDG